jgi:hypothetical protein
MVEPDQLSDYSDRDMAYFNDVDCSVDDDDVFSFRSRKDNFACLYRYDPMPLMIVICIGSHRYAHKHVLHGHSSLPVTQATSKSTTIIFGKLS